MSFGERFDTDLADSDTDKKNPNVITRCQSMMVNEDQYGENWNKIRETSSLPIDSSCSQWVEQRARKNIIPHGSGGRATRSRNLTEKGLEYMKETLRETRRKISGRLIRKYSSVEDLLFLSKNINAAEEQMKQFNELFKMLLEHIKKTISCWEMMKKEEMTIGLMMLTLKCVPSRGKCIVG